MSQIPSQPTSPTRRNLLKLDDQLEVSNVDQTILARPPEGVYAGLLQEDKLESNDLLIPAQSPARVAMSQGSERADSDMRGGEKEERADDEEPLLARLKMPRSPRSEHAEESLSSSVVDILKKSVNISQQLSSQEEQEIMSRLDSKLHQRPISHVQGLIWCFIFGLSRGGMYAGSKYAQATTDVALRHVILTRSLMLLVGSYIYGKSDGVDFGFSTFSQFPQKVQYSLFKRSFYAFGSTLTTFAAIQLMPVSIAVSIMMTTAFVTSLMGWCLQGERLSLLEIFSIIGGFSGVIILTNPTLFEGSLPEVLARQSQDAQAYPYFAWGVVIAFVFAVVSALNFLAMREMGHCVHSSVKTFYFGLLSSFLTLIYIVVDDPQTLALWKIGSKDYPITSQQALACLFIGFFSWASQESLSLAVTVVKAGTTAAFFNFGLVISFALDVCYFKRQAFLSDYAGTVLIVVFTTYQSYLTQKEHDEEESRASSLDEPSIGKPRTVGTKNGSSGSNRDIFFIEQDNNSQISLTPRERLEMDSDIETAPKSRQIDSSVMSVDKTTAN